MPANVSCQPGSCPTELGPVAYQVSARTRSASLESSDDIEHTLRAGARITRHLATAISHTYRAPLEPEPPDYTSPCPRHGKRGHGKLQHDRMRNHQAGTTIRTCSRVLSHSWLMLSYM